jgi:hypothetical protein
MKKALIFSIVATLMAGQVYAENTLQSALKSALKKYLNETSYKLEPNMRNCCPYPIYKTKNRIYYVNLVKDFEGHPRINIIISFENNGSCRIIQKKFKRNATEKDIEQFIDKELDL